MTLHALKANTEQEICEQLEKAKEKAGECDSVLILMEKRRGGLMYLANNSVTISTMIWMVDRFKYFVHSTLASDD